MYGQQLSPRKTVQLLVLLTLLAWATQTFMHQWARGDDAPEQFVPSSGSNVAGATLELRGEATIVGGEIKLRQVCRWCEADKPAFEPIADLVLARVAANAPFRAITLDQLKQTLRDAGVNLSVVHFAGALSCTVSRGDVVYNEQTALQEWIDAKQTPTTQASPAPSGAVAGGGPGSTEAQPAGYSAQAPGAAAEDKQYHTLRDLLLSDLSERLSLPVESLEVHFNPEDDKVLNLTEPQFRFNVDGHRARMLGQVAWEVTLVPNAGPAKKITVIAIARAWQDQVLSVKAIAYKQIIRDQDLVTRRVLVDQMSSEIPATRDQILNQMAGHELKAGTIMTPQLVDAVPLATPGQLVTVIVEQGSVQIRTAARAMEAGAFGQTIRVRNESTRDMYDIVLTGPQTGKMVANAVPEGAKPQANAWEHP